MDFEDSPEEAAFRAEASAFLEREAPGFGGRGDVAAAKAWQGTKAEAGFAGITWPRRFGGRGGTPMQQVIWNQEEEKYQVPRGVFEIGLGMCVPTVMAYAEAAVCERLVGPALRGETIWCQLFSEPAAGSDVAGLRMRAEREGDGWRINGQKIWTSGAHFSDFGLLLARTDPSVPKHRGLTMFFVEMGSPGIEVRRIRQISGESNFNEVFFTNVWVPDGQRLGEVGDGWRVALTTLMHERLAIGSLPGPDFEDLLTLAQEIAIEGAPAIGNAAVRERLADWYVQSQGLEYTKWRAITALSRGQMPGPEASIYKLVSARKIQDLSGFALDLLGEAGLAAGGRFAEAWLQSPGGRIAGGTDEILRNIIAERVLGLPGDIRLDRDKPFNA